MSGSLSGIGAQQQPPISNTFKPGEQSNQVREREESQPQAGAAPTESAKNVETVIKSQQGEALKAKGSDENAVRGSLLDIKV